MRPVGARRPVWRLGWIALAVAVILAVFSGAWQPPDRRLRYAVHTLPADDHMLQLAREAGVNTIVELFSWRQIEPTEGQFHWQHPDEVVQGRNTTGWTSSHALTNTRTGQVKRRST